VFFDQENLRIQLGDFLLMENGQPLPFDRAAASAYLKQKGARPSNEVMPAAGSTRPPSPADFTANTVAIAVSIGNGSGSGKAWGCDLSYDYVKINAEYTT
jgi:glutamate N-acetyltransferase/amino-acid N-acetyltransferase